MRPPELAHALLIGDVEYPLPVTSSMQWVLRGLGTLVPQIQPRNRRVSRLRKGHRPGGPDLGKLPFYH
jgi:hypothetical protein